MKYYSEKLEKLFDTVEALEKAEKEKDDEKITYQKALQELNDLYKAYLNAITKANDEKDKALDQVRFEHNEKIKKINANEGKAYQEATKKFNEKYGHGKTLFESLFDVLL